MQFLINIRWELCNGCEQCLRICPVWVYKEARAGKIVLDRETACDGCELCVPACPTNAIRIKSDEDYNPWNIAELHQSHQNHRRIEIFQNYFPAKSEISTSIILYDLIFADWVDLKNWIDDNLGEHIIPDGMKLEVTPDFVRII